MSGGARPEDPARLGRAATLLLLISLSGCGILGIGEGDIRTLEVAAQKGTCFGWFATLCLQVRESADQDFENMFGTPRGFDYEWGYRYIIEIEETEIENPPADGSSIRRELREVRSRTPVTAGEAFGLRIIPGGIVSKGGGLFDFYGEEEMVCSAAEVDCAGFAEAAADGELTLFVGLAHPDRIGDPFEIRSWSICADVFGPC